VSCVGVSRIRVLCHREFCADWVWAKKSACFRAVCDASPACAEGERRFMATCVYSCYLDDLQLTHSSFVLYIVYLTG
jgi:hypothetical protein